MAYCEAQEVREMLKDDALNSIIGDTYIEDEDEREAKIQPIVESAIADAEGEVDGYLAKRYPVPLSVVPKAISKFTKDIAVYNLYSRIGIDESDKEKNYLNRYRAAVDFLKFVAEGKIDLGVGSTQTSAASTGFSVSASPRVFGRGSMRGM